MAITVQQADWKKEKHVPVIEVMGLVKAGEAFQVKVSIGKEIAHPNTTEHHINWITLYFQPEGAKFPLQVGHYEFAGHGDSMAGPNLGPLHAEPEVIATVKIAKGGMFHALAMCNIHGLWEGEQEVKVS
jgi:superoxide reductase